MKRSLRMTATCVLMLSSPVALAPMPSGAAAPPRPSAVTSVAPGGAAASAVAVRLTQPAPPPADNPSSGRFSTLPAGSLLPTDAACAAAVRSAPELRPVNSTPNHTRGVLSAGVAPAVAGQPVTGNFVGSTDEIIQWTACKWGVDEDLVRAQIAKESSWHMDAYGDAGTDQSACAPQFRGGATCPQSIGLGQVRFGYHGSAFVNDNAINSSAYNLDYTYSRWRACFEGYETWFNSFERGQNYAAGDEWGCIGAWFAGRWRTDPANRYIAEVQEYLASRIWESSGFVNW